MPKQKIVCEGREEVLQLCGEYIEKYIPQKSFIFNLHGEGGIGKTVVTQEMYKNYLQYITECHMGIKAIYINASGCFSIPALLLRLRMSLGNDMYDFEKFDVMYELFFDASEYVKLKRMMEITTPQDQNLANFILDFTIKEINRDYEELRRNPVDDPISYLIKFTGPIIDRIPIKTILKVINDNSKFKKYYGIVEELIKSKGIFKEEKKLIEFFIEAVTDTEGNIKSPFLFFIDNFQNITPGMDKEFRFQNIDGFYRLMENFPAFWFISSRNILAYPKDNFFEFKLNGLSANAAKHIIWTTRGAEKVTNLEDVAENILVLSEENDNEQDIQLYSPIIISILCQVLEKEIEKIQEDHLEQNEFELSPDIFSDIPDRPALTYYYEMGKTSVDLDCFHILSCTDVWDEYTFEVLKEKLHFYLLNTRHILAQDSMTELLGDNSIKLHDRISEALRESASNRIRFDVYSIMYDAFLEIQQLTPILEEKVLKNFFIFAREYCKNLEAGAYYYKRENAYNAYSVFYRAFLKSVEIIKERIPETMIELYWNVIREFKNIAFRCKIKNSDEIVNAYHKLGIVVYDVGDSKKAQKVDQEFLSTSREFENVLGEIVASNALAVDCSANHLYEEAYSYGKGSLQKASETVDAHWLKKLYEFYFRYLQLPENEEGSIYYTENHKSVIKENAELLKKISSIGKDNIAYKAKKIWESMLNTRGNIPWYLIEDSALRKKKSQYALSYGQDTYNLRKYYYGEEDPKTLQSFHNLGVYLMKYAEYCDAGDIYDTSHNIENMLSEAKRIFSEVFVIRKKVLKVNLNIDKEQYFQEMEDEVSSEGLCFLDVYNRSEIERYFIEGYDNYPVAALESLQYESNVCYLLGKKTMDVIKSKEKLDEAIRISDRVTVARSFLLGLHHRKTLESMRYSAEYYWEKGDKESARKRIRYAFEHLDKDQISEKQYEEYKQLKKMITDEI